MLLGGGHQFIGQHVREASQTLEVGGCQLDGEQVGHEGPSVTNSRGPIIHGAAHGRRDLDRLDLGLECLGEDTMNGSFEPALDTIKDSHGYSFLMLAFRS
jgi:hypothetical protein